MLNDFIAQDPRIIELLGYGRVVISEEKVPGGYEKWDEGKPFPTFLEPVNAKELNGRYIKKLPINTCRRIRFRTDANNDYLSRTNSPGQSYCNPDIPEKSVKLRNGIASFTIWPPPDAKVGDKICCDIGFEDNCDFRPSPLYASFTIEITEAEKTGNNPTSPLKETKDREKPRYSNPIHWVEKDDWGEYDFDEKSGAAVVVGDDGIKVHVNRAHERLVEMKRGTADEAVIKLNESRFKISLGLLTLSVYRYYEKNEEDVAERAEDAADLAKEASKGIATYILSIIRILGKEEQS